MAKTDKAASHDNGIQSTGGIVLSGAADVTKREDEGRVVHMRNEDGDLAYYQNGEGVKPVTIRIAGSYSKLYRRIEDQLRGRQLRQLQASLTPEQVRAREVELCAGCILGWEGLMESPEGPELKFNKENATALVSACIWIYRQLSAAQEDHAGFSSAASQS